ncbi:unnamed protein product, partial [Anisakis simplex]|uniref:Putative kunitz-type protease inhibitor (inferred by orthology to a S. mansoni protein) n=1 Tax=Anisakis simplex TaxID=6269 RepID=A0A0M3KBM2_ANISI
KSFSGEVDPCKRQPFRGRCPAVSGGQQTRSQMFSNLGHCSKDTNEPRLYRYKEECEDACLNVVRSNNNVQKTEDIASPTASSTSTQPTTSTSVTSDESRKSAPNDCTSAVDAGPCESSVSRWYYDANEQTCKPFSYSGQWDCCIISTIPGCGGNGNNYLTKFACERRCTPVLDSSIKCPNGAEPLKNVHGVPTTCAKKSCPSDHKCTKVEQNSICCPVPEDESKKSSSKADVCALPKERGPCDRYELRFYYNSDMKECKYFFFGGCEGNANNFERVEDCESACGRGRKALRIESPQTVQTKPTTAAPTTTAMSQEATTVEQIPEAEETEASKVPGIVEHPTSASTKSAPSTAAKNVDSVHLTGEPETSVNIDTTSTTVTTTPEQPTTQSSAPSRKIVTDPPVEPLVSLIKPQDINQPDIIPPLPETKTCDVFTYSGCSGNGNNFANREECLSICNRQVNTKTSQPSAASLCAHKINPGDCKGEFERFAFDTETGKCRPFIYGGCGGNGNNFASLEECAQRCHPQGCCFSSNLLTFILSRTYNICLFDMSSIVSYHFCAILH